MMNTANDADNFLQDLDLENTIGDIDFDEIMIGATHDESHKGVSAEILSKIWKIDLNTAERTLDVTIQRLHRSIDPSLSRILQMTACYVTNAYIRGSLWIPSLQHPKLEDLREEILAYNFLSLTKDSYMLSQCDPKVKCHKP